MRVILTGDRYSIGTCCIKTMAYQNLGEGGEEGEGVRGGEREGEVEAFGLI